MPRSKQAERRRIAKLRAEFNAAPWAIDARSLGMLGHAFESGDLDAIKATLSLGNTPESITKIVNGVAIIPVTGVLQDECNYMVRWGYASSYQLIERDFNQAMDNNNVKGVLFYFNSPGGSAIGCKRVADLVFESRGIKPVRSFVQGVCCSAAFYIATATDRIECTADSLVGSVGTILPHMEYSGMLKEFGIGAEVFTNTDSPKKGHGNMYEPLSDEAKKTLQQFVNSYGRPFIEDVARYRAIGAAEVVKNFGQGDALRADVAIGRQMVDAVVDNFDESLESISAGGTTVPVETDEEPVADATSNLSRRSVMNERIKAQLFALGLIDSLDASDAICTAARNSFFAGRGVSVPSDEAQILATLQAPSAKVESQKSETPAKPADNVQAAHKAEQDEAKAEHLEDLRSAAATMNSVAGKEVITDKMVLDALSNKLDARGAMDAWKEALAKDQPPVPGAKVDYKGEGADRYAEHVIEALAHRCTNSSGELSENAAAHIRKPLSHIAAECLSYSGRTDIDPYDNREYIAEEAMSMGQPGKHDVRFSANEQRQYVKASAAPATRPGDFPNIMSGLQNKYLDSIELDQDYSYGDISAVLPGGLNDFKPGLMINKGIVEEMDEVQDAEAFEELGLSEEVLSYIFMRRFGNKFGWTPLMIANDDLNAFAEGMLGFEEAWQVTQNRLVLDLITSNPTLLDGVALFANRDDTGTGTNPATNDNDLASGGSTPSDAQWALMEAKYADIGGIATGRRVRGTLNTWFGPTGTPFVEARRTFLPLSTGGLEPKSADTTANVGIYRGLIKLVPESELRTSSLLKWYGFRSPTRLNTATIIRAYFNGFGTAGRRERWYDPERKVLWMSLEGRVASAVKNWRYVIRNKGEN